MEVQLPFHMKVKVACWSSPCQLLICPPPTQDQQRWSPFHAKVEVDCWSSLHWLDSLYIDCWPLYIDCWPPLYIDCWYIDCWPSLHWLSICPPPPLPGSTEAIAFSCKSESWLLILMHQSLICPLLPPKINRGDCLFMWKWKLDCWSSLHWLSIDLKRGRKGTLFCSVSWVDFHNNKAWCHEMLQHQRLQGVSLSTSLYELLSLSFNSLYSPVFYWAGPY